MATKKKNRQNGAQRKDEDEAAARVARALGRYAAEHGEDRPPGYLLEAVQELIDSKADDREAPPRRNTTDEGLHTGGALSRSLGRGRHDEKRASGGRRYRDGLLLPRASGEVLREPSPRERAILKSLSLTLTMWHEKPRPITDSKARALEAAYEAIFGHRWDEPEWQRTLIAQLEQDEEHREERRLRALHGEGEPEGTYLLGDRLAPEPDIGATLEPADGAAILRYLQKLGTNPPAELTAEAIEAMRAKVGFGGGGPTGKRRARNIVAEFVKALEKR